MTAKKTKTETAGEAAARALDTALQNIGVELSEIADGEDVPQTVAFQLGQVVGQVTALRTVWALVVRAQQATPRPPPCRHPSLRRVHPMTDVSAQAFREAAIAPHLVPVVELERLLLAAAEMCEQVDYARGGTVTITLPPAEDLPNEFRFTVTKDCPRHVIIQTGPSVSEQIATLTAERDEARATLALLTKHPTTTPLQRELLDLITLMPDVQTQELLDYITDLRAIRQQRDAPTRPA